MKNLKLYSLLFFILFIGICYSQNRVIDSLKILINADKNDTNKVNHLNALAFKYEYINPDSTLLLMKQALALAQSLNWLKAIGSTNQNLGLLYANRGEFSVALGYYNKSLEAWKEIEQTKGPAFKKWAIGRVSKTLGNIGIVYFQQGNYTQALDNYLRALKIDEENGFKANMARQLANIGVLYDNQSDHDKALEYFFRALEVAYELKSENIIAINLGNIGIAYDKKGDRKNALDYYLKALQIFEKSEDQFRIASCLGNIGTVYQDMKNYDMALEYFLKALQLHQKFDDKANMALWQGNIGNNYMLQKNYPKAKEYLLSSLNTAKQIGSLDDIKSAHQYLADLYYETGNFKEALKQFKLYTVFKDSLFNEEKSKELTRHEMNYEFEKKQTAIKAGQEKKDAVAAAESRKQRSVIILVCSALLLVFIFAGFVFRSLKITRKQKVLIEIKNRETEEQKLEIEAKNKDILDSIRYAKRIQTSLMPTQKYIERNLNALKSAN